MSNELIHSSVVHTWKSPVWTGTFRKRRSSITSMYQGSTPHYFPCSLRVYSTGVRHSSDRMDGCENDINVPGYSRIPQYVERKPPLQILGDKFKRKLGYGSEFEAPPKKTKSLFDDDDEDEYNYDTQAWINKRVKSWSLLDTKNWLYLTSQEMGQLYRELSPKFALTGEELLLLSRQDFANIDSNFGTTLYDSLHQIVDGERAFWSPEVPYRFKTANPVLQAVDGRRAFCFPEVPYRLKTSSPVLQTVGRGRAFWSPEVPHRFKTRSPVHQMVKDERDFWSPEVPHRFKTSSPVHQIVDEKKPFWSSEVPYRLKTSSQVHQMVKDEKAFWSSEVPYRLKTSSPVHQVVDEKKPFWSSEVPYRFKISSSSPVHHIVKEKEAFWSPEVPYRLKTSSPVHQIVDRERAIGSLVVPYRLKTVSEIKVEASSSDEEAIRGSEGFFAVREEEPSTRNRPVKQRGEKCRRANSRTRARTDVRTAGLKIWEFIRNLLLDPNYCPAWICWENYEDKSFRFIENEKIARLWGSRNNNEKMNYRDFSRAMRYHYRMDKLAIVRPSRKLVYKFGPKAIGLETDDPNFQIYHRYKEKGLPDKPIKK